MDPVTLGVMAALIAVTKVMGGFAQFNMLRSAGKMAREQGKLQQQVLNQQGLQHWNQGNAAAAAGQRGALAARHEGTLIGSRARALAAASGADLSSPSIVATVGDIDAATQYAAAVQLYNGASREQALKYQSKLDVWSGEMARRTGTIQRNINYAQANQKLLSSFIDAGGTIGSAAAGGAFSGGGATPEFESQLGTAGGMGSMSGWEPTAGGGMGSPLFQMYGAGGVNNVRYP